MAIKMRVLYASSKKKINNIANEIKAKYDLGVNAVDTIPPAYSCDRERVVVLAISAKGGISDALRLFCRELNKSRAQNVALMIDGDEKAANTISGHRLRVRVVEDFVKLRVVTVPDRVATTRQQTLYMEAEENLENLESVKRTILTFLKEYQKSDD